MPKDKTQSHEKIKKAAMELFLEKGFEQTSMKAVADAVGMTSAALYRHFADKQDMFAALVEPLVQELNAWIKKHRAVSYEALTQDNTEQLWSFEGDFTDAAMVLGVMYAHPKEARLLISRSNGTPYEHFVHDMIEECVDAMLQFLESCKAKGAPVHEITRNEMHMLVSAYCAALLQPVEHGYDKAEAECYLRTMVDFFTPGWRLITGI